ncbi:MAG TPA: TonB-dependent receptor [Steroidobacteraceae bacterium]|nr:TonB-dependent receptor [Steroidobacteraceae bacterium]
MLDITLDSKCTILICLVAVMASPTGITRAWGQAAPVGEHDKDVGLQEIIVTATRRETKLSDTPIAMSVVTADQIDNQRIVNFNDVELAVPNFVFTQVTRQETYFSIRGTGVDNDTPGSDAGVSVFIDGVPRTGVHDTTPDLFDLQSVEVLRGPQGTLFGRNTTGGAVIMRTISPSFDPAFKGQLTYGNYNLVEVNGLATGPLVSNSLAGKFSFLLHGRDGYVDNIVQNRENGREKSGSMRAQLLWLPTDDVKVMWGAEYLRDTSQSRVGGLESTFVPSLFPTLQFGPDVTNAALTPQASDTIVGLSANAEWSTGPGTLTSITGYRSVTSGLLYAPLGDPATALLADQSVKDRQYTEEVHFLSSLGGRFTWVAGLFYLHLDRLDDTLFTAFPVPGTVFSLQIPSGAMSAHDQEVLTTSRAVFGEATYALRNALDLTVGARYSSEHRSGHSEVTPTESSGPYAHSWSAFTPKATLSFKPSKQWLTYATVAKGFTSGGFDASASTNDGLRTPFNPESVINYELGAKLTGLDRRISVNTAIFLADYTNLQRTAFDSNPAVNSYRTTNAGKARVKGIEAEITYLPVSWLTLAGNYAYTDAKYREYDALQDNGSTISYAGNTLPQTPKQQFHFSSEIAVPWTRAGGEVMAGADYTYRSEIQFVDANDTPQAILNKTRIDGFVNLHLGWRSASEKMSVNLFARDISNKRALVSFPDFTPYFATFPEYSDPRDHIYLSRYTPLRTFGVTFTVRY